MLRVMVMALVVISNFVLQSTLFQMIRIRGIVPNTMIGVIVSYALLRGSVEGAVLGVCAGLLPDIFFGNSIGFHSLLGLLCGYFCGIFNKNFYRENYILPFVLTILCSFFVSCAIFVFHFLFRGKTDFIFFLNNTIIPETVYTTILSFIVYRLMYAINNKIEENYKYKAKLY